MIKLPLISLLSAVVIIYPNLACLPWELSFLDESKHASFWIYFVFRYLYFSILFFILLYENLIKMKTTVLKTRFSGTFLITLAAFLIFLGISFIRGAKSDFFSTLTCQFFIVCVITTFAGHISILNFLQRKHEQEIEQLKIENLQSRYSALTNQINPHFFFNSLNGISALIRRKNDDVTQAYINKMSDVFRYILQSEKKELVTLGEELSFVEAFQYMMEVRFANKLKFDFLVDANKMHLKLPVLSLLPLIDNVVIHNIIDSDHKMTVSISLDENQTLIVSNPIYPKLTLPDTNGTGIKNLENRFLLLMDKPIRIVDDGKTFSVCLPLKE